MDYSKTVNLLQTDFPMKADLPQREPQTLSRWAEARLYESLLKSRQGKPLFFLHDGPPYANGDIHMGHALNKILKDFVVKYKTLAGFQAPYKPGWDCHGLPIEHQLFKQLGKSKHQVSRQELRQKAAEYALGFVNKQKDDFKRLGVLGEWEDPYLTLTKEYEAATVETFFDLWEKGFIYRGLKPGYWCAYDETALAEAEVEYAEKSSDSVYVRFKVKMEKPADGETFSKPAHEKIIEQFADSPVYVLIWTTTPWTLPANQALAFHPDEKYSLVKKGGELYVVADKLKEAVSKKIGGETVPGSSSFYGKDFEFLKAVNPLNRREPLIINAGYVTMEDGTGIVHIAPGHGVEDFAAGQSYRLKVESPVDERGSFNETVEPQALAGKHVLKDANQAVIDTLKENLLFHEIIRHSYPHCWRCKNPILFRATEQWFLRVEGELRKKLLDQIERVQWQPAHGIHRIKGMVEQRPDWCLSRQRHWGTPIAAFYCENKNCRQLLWDKTLNKKLVELFRSHGADVYYQKSEQELFSSLGLSPVCAQCGGKTFRKETDILDVWFDSGVSWHAVVEAHFANPKPQTILYLEGSDQHRGWFQTSLIPSVALRGKAPYDIVLTHGFVVDGKGHKMSKSMGNVISPQEIIQKYGADILRLWVATSDYREDVRLSNDIIKHTIDLYRRFRNTFRFLLQNTADFKRASHEISLGELQEIDRWILVHFESVKRQVEKAYDSYEFHIVLSELNRFVSVTLSGFYLDALKDWLYCEAPGSARRRSAQTALFHLMRGLSTLLAPVLSFTAEEAYVELRKTSDPDLPTSVFLDDLTALISVPQDDALNQKWTRILEIRSMVNDVLDRQRKAGVVRSSQEARVHINSQKLDPSHRDAVLSAKEDWPFILQMSEVQINGHQAEDDAIRIESTKNAKCERCWRHRPDVGKDARHPALCGRCVSVVSALT